jgi:hypothetical protein
MHPQLAAVAEQFAAALRRLQALERTLSPERWTRRPAPERWSAIECVQHLNLTGASTLPRVRQGVAEATLRMRSAPARYRRDFVGWLIWRSLERPGRFKTKTAVAFVPQADRPPAEILGAFTQLQAEHLACVQACDGLPIERVRIASPFNERVHYNVYSCLTILAAHQHRHLWQAEEAAAGR